MHRALILVFLAWLLAACNGFAVSPAQPSVAPATPTSPGPKWIQVVLAEQMAYLWRGDQLVTSLLVSTGVGTSPETTTFPGEFEVAAMYSGPEETVPGVFVRDVVIFDWEHGNGFHSLPMDAQGVVLDETLGKPASAGCVRVKDSGVLYDFAELGMKVVIR